MCASYTVRACTRVRLCVSRHRLLIDYRPGYMLLPTFVAVDPVPVPTHLSHWTHPSKPDRNAHRGATRHVHVTLAPTLTWSKSSCQPCNSLNNKCHLTRPCAPLHSPLSPLAASSSVSPYSSYIQFILIIIIFLLLIVIVILLQIYISYSFLPIPHCTAPPP